MTTYAKIGIQSPEILLPNRQIDYAKWAVVACDQYTSEPEYWQEVERIAADSPSTYRMILPEAYLGTPREAVHQQQIDATMRSYLEKDIFTTVNGFIYTERSVAHGTRHGLIVALDLEQYSFQQGSQSLIRATEGTIIERLPPRIKIRKSALLEIPHILVLIDDPNMTVIEPLAENKNRMPALYDFDLMQNGGHLSGFLVDKPEIENQIITALGKLADPQVSAQRYHLTGKEAPFLYAVGDGNHSLATAKSIWEEIKNHVSAEHPARFALVELVNIHDAGIIFEPIHRLLKNISCDLTAALRAYWQDALDIVKQADFSELKENVISQSDGTQKFGLIEQNCFNLVTLRESKHSLTVGSVQDFLDQLRSQNKFEEIDYVHGDETILKLGSQKGNAAIFLPALAKSHLFEAVIKDGELPRKTFSMGEANEKRFYLECRKIQTS